MWRSSNSCTLRFVCRSIGPIGQNLTATGEMLQVGVHAGEWQGEKSTEVSLSNKGEAGNHDSVSAHRPPSRRQRSGNLHAVFSRICFVCFSRSSSRSSSSSRVFLTSFSRITMTMEVGRFVLDVKLPPREFYYKCKKKKKKVIVRNRRRK